MELVDVMDSKSIVLTLRAGPSPAFGTNKRHRPWSVFFCAQNDICACTRDNLRSKKSAESACLVLVHVPSREGRNGFWRVSTSQNLVPPSAPKKQPSNIRLLFCFLARTRTKVHSFASPSCKTANNSFLLYQYIIRPSNAVPRMFAAPNIRSAAHILLANRKTRNCSRYRPHRYKQPTSPVLRCRIFP